MGAIRVHVTQRLPWIHLQPNTVFLPSVAILRNDDAYAALDGNVHEAFDGSES